MKTSLNKSFDNNAATPSRSGMSMVEIMIGVLILALVLIPSITVIISETRSVTATRDHNQAAFFAQKIIEAAKSYSFEYLSECQFPPSEAAERRKTFEWALKNSNAANTEQINNVVYRVVNPRIDPAKNRLAPDDPAIIMLFSFTVEYRALSGRDHRLDVSTAIFREQ